MKRFKYINSKLKDMIPLFTVDYTDKILHIALRENGEDKGRGLIYNPKQIYSKLNEISEHHYEEFFEAGNEVKIVTIKTRQGPGELAKRLVKEFEVNNYFGIGGILAPFDATIQQGEKILEDLLTNSKKYYESEEEKWFSEKPAKRKRASLKRKLLE